MPAGCAVRCSFGFSPAAFLPCLVSLLLLLFGCVGGRSSSLALAARLLCRVWASAALASPCSLCCQPCFLRGWLPFLLARGAQFRFRRRVRCLSCPRRFRCSQALCSSLSRLGRVSWSGWAASQVRSFSQCLCRRAFLLFPVRSCCRVQVGCRRLGFRRLRGQCPCGFVGSRFGRALRLPAFFCVVADRQPAAKRTSAEA